MKKSFFLVIVVFLSFIFAVVAVAQDYLLGPGDTLYVIIWGDEGLSGPVLIAPDGTIALPEPVGVMQAKGMTVKQVEVALISKLTKFVKTPRVTVSLRERETGFPVHITGEVLSPSFYKVPEGTTLQELITRAGGFSKYSDIGHIKITSQNEGGATTVRVVDFSQFLIGNNEIANPVLKPNDTIFIPRISNKEYLSNIVSVLGSVKEPGAFELKEDMALIDVIAFRGGFSIDADLGKIQVMSDSGIINVNIKEFLTKKDPLGNPTIKSKMIVYVPSTIIPTELTVPVNIIGQVSRPGAYRVVVEKSRLMDAIFTAGGFTETADIEKVKIIRQDTKETTFNPKEFLTKGDTTQNPLLREGDTVVVTAGNRVKQITSVIDTAFVPYKEVKIIGAVRSPGTFQISESATLLDVLILGGGATSTADLERATITRKGQKLEVDLRKVLTEGRLETVPALTSEDVVFIPEQRESKWGKFIRLTGQLSTISLLGVYIITLIGR